MYTCVSIYEFRGTIDSCSTETIIEYDIYNTKTQVIKYIYILKLIFDCVPQGYNGALNGNTKTPQSVHLSFFLFIPF